MTPLEHLENLFEAIPQDRKAAKARSFVILQNYLAGKTSVLQDAEDLFDAGWLSATNEAARRVLQEYQQAPDDGRLLTLFHLFVEQGKCWVGAQPADRASQEGAAIG